jgi:hypothetical protein
MISETAQINQIVGARTRSKILILCILRVQGLFFPTYDPIVLKVKEILYDKKIKLGILDCKKNQNILMKYKSQIEFN